MRAGGELERRTLIWAAADPLPLSRYGRWVRSGVSRVGWLAGLAFATRAVWGFVTIRQQVADAADYLLLGTNLKGGHGFSLDDAAPFRATDFRLPGYPALLALFRLVLSQDVAIVLLNASLGALAVVGLVLIAERVIPHPWPVVVGVVGAVWPPMVTYTGYALTENLTVAAVTWLVWGAAAEPGRRRDAAMLLASIGLLFCRAEGIVIVAAALAIVYAGRAWRTGAVIGLVLVALTVGWVARNDAQVGRLELTDPAYRNATLLLSVNHGDINDPDFQQGVGFARRAPVGDNGRSEYQQLVKDRLSDGLTGSTVAYKMKSVASLPFGPVVYEWANTSAGGSVGDALAGRTPRDLARLAWDAALAVMYVLAAAGLWSWWQEGRKRLVLAVLLYPVVVLLVSVPFHAEQRLWFAAAWVLVVPAVGKLSARRSTSSAMTSPTRSRSAAQT